MPTSHPARARRRRPIRTPSLLQMEVAECGAAALGIMLAYFGRIVPLTELRQQCGVSRDGSNALNLVKAARRYGLESAGYSAEVEEVLAWPQPCIVFWDFNHFVVVEGFRRGRVRLNDPAVGHRRVSMQEFEDEFTGLVLDMVPGPDFERGGRRPSLARALWSRLSGFWPALSFSLLAGLLLVLPALAIPALTQVYIDDVVIQERADWLRPLVLAVLIAVAAQGILSFLQLRCLRRLELGLSARLSAGFFRHLLRLPVDFYAQRFAGEIGNRSQINDKVAGVLSGELAQTAIGLVMMCFYAALMAFYNVTLTLVGVACAVINLAALRKIARWRVESNMRLLQEYGKVTGTSIAGLQSIETLKASGLEDGFFRRWAGHFARATNARQEFELSSQILGLLPSLLFAVSNTLVLVLGGLQVIEGNMTIGMLMAFQMLMIGFLRPVGSLVQLGQTIQELQGDLARLDDVLAHPPEPEPEPAAAAVPAADPDRAAPPQLAASPRLRGHLHLRSVTFGYNPGSPPLLENFELTLQPGRSVALVGPSGSGKSTVARLVCGLYSPWSGEVLLDGRPRSEYAKETLADSLSFVDQEPQLFGGTVRDNLTLWDDTVPDTVLVSACRDVGMLEAVRGLPGELDALLHEGGANLSGGEQQRLEIARALVSNPTLLVLDEATSSLDAESERKIVAGIAARGCSCLVIAHRLSTIRHCDEILVLDHGRVVERGTHEQLWRKDGEYAALLRMDEELVGCHE